MNAVSLGPIIELAQLATAGTLPAPERAEWLALDGLSVLYRWVISGRFRWVCPDGRRIGFLRTRAQRPSDDHELIGFSVAAQQAAVISGFPESGCTATRGGNRRASQQYLRTFPSIRDRARHIPGRCRRIRVSGGGSRCRHPGDAANLYGIRPSPRPRERTAACAQRRCFAVRITFRSRVRVPAHFHWPRQHQGLFTVQVRRPRPHFGRHKAISDDGKTGSEAHDLRLLGLDHVRGGRSSDRQLANTERLVSGAYTWNSKIERSGRSRT